MASICSRCALRLQRIALKEASSSTAATRRAFSAGSTRQRALQSFPETSNDELNGLFSTLRKKHIIPAYLSDRERGLILKPKNRQYLQDNPQTVELGGEEIQLEWLDKTRDIPARLPLIKRILDLILESKDNKAWESLPALMQSMREGVKKPLTEAQMERIVRKGFEQNQYVYVMQCLQQAEKTGMSLNQEPVLRAVMHGLRELAQKSNWEKSHVEQALKNMHSVACMLESPDHWGIGARRRPKVLGVMLELTAVYAYKHLGSQDTNGMVKSYADRLLSCMREWHLAPTITLAEKGPQWHFLQAIPVLHGVFLANKTLGSSMPKQELATQIIASYEERLSAAAATLEARSELTRYDDQALQAWRRCIRD